MNRKKPETKSAVKWWLDWRKLSIIELVVIIILFVCNDYLGSSADYSDFSPLLVVLTFIGIVMQGKAFTRNKNVAWRSLAVLAVLLHVATILYLLIIIGYTR